MIVCPVNKICKVFVVYSCYSSLPRKNATKIHNYSDAEKRKYFVRSIYFYSDFTSDWNFFYQPSEMLKPLDKITKPLLVLGIIVP